MIFGIFHTPNAGPWNDATVSDAHSAHPTTNEQAGFDADSRDTRN